MGSATNALPPPRESEPGRQHRPPPMAEHSQILNLGAVGFAPDLTAGQCQAGNEARSCCTRLSTAFPHPPQLCSWLSTDRLSWLIPASSEHPALLQVPSTVHRDTATPCSGRPWPSQHHWVGLEHSQPDCSVPHWRGPGGYFHFWSIYNVCSYKQGSKNNSSVPLGCPEMLRVALGWRDWRFLGLGLKSSIMGRLFLAVVTFYSHSRQYGHAKHCPAPAKPGAVDGRQ